MPERLRDSPARARRIKLTRTIVIAYLGFCGIGFALGALLGHGNPAHRLAAGALGLVAAMVAVWFIALVLNVGHGAHGALRPQSRVRP